MFGWLRSRRPPADPSRIRDGVVVWAVGDIHGRADLLGTLVGRLAAEAARAPDTRHVLIYLGDHVDRGLRSRDVIDMVRVGPPVGFEQVCLRGNHEQAMLDFLDGLSDGTDWLRYGGLETLLSYGVSVKGLPTSREASDALRVALAAAVPEAHIAFLRSTVLYHVEDDYLFVHAGVRDGIALRDQVSDDLLWIRDEFLSRRDRYEGRVVVHGHTVTDRPHDRPHRIGIDTGAFASGRLTAVALSGADRRFIDTAGAGP